MLATGGGPPSPPSPRRLAAAAGCTPPTAAAAVQTADASDRPSCTPRLPDGAAMSRGSGGFDHQM